jgi:hypothetical protein
MPLAPHARAVVTACLTWRAAPRPEPVLPPRSHASAITCAAVGTDSVVTNGDSPLRSSARPAILACPNEAPCFWCLHRAQQRVDVQECPLLDAGQQRSARRERHQMLAGYRGELVGMPEAELTQQDPPRVDGAYTSSNIRGVPPARNTLASSMLSAPHIMPAMIVVSLPAGLTAPEATRVLGSSTCSPINRERPVCSANSSTGTKPAADTRFGSSNTADPTANVCDDCTGNAFRNRDDVDFDNRYFSVQEAFSLFTHRSDHPLIHGFRLRHRYTLSGSAFATASHRQHRQAQPCAASPSNQ